MILFLFISKYSLVKLKEINIFMLSFKNHYDKKSFFVEIQYVAKYAVLF